MIEARLLQKLQTHLERLQRPVELIAHLDSSVSAQRMHALLEQITALHPRLSLVVRQGFQAHATPNEHSPQGDLNLRLPSFSVGAVGEAARVHFAGVPMGHEFTSLVLALLQAGGVTPRLDEALIERARNLSGSFVFETFISLSCQNCPEVVLYPHSTPATHLAL